jgi:hypothetical protein
MAEFEPTEFDPKLFDLAELPRENLKSLPGYLGVVSGDSGRTVNQRFRDAGYALAAVLFDDRGPKSVIFPTRRSPESMAVTEIWRHEAAGVLAPGSAMSAMQSIGEGEFNSLWGNYLPASEA